MIVDNAAKLINKKNIAPQTLLPGISLNTFGSVINTKFGPLPGFTPNAKHAGKITSPAINATNVSRIATGAEYEPLSVDVNLDNTVL